MLHSRFYLIIIWLLAVHIKNYAWDNSRLSDCDTIVLMNGKTYGVKNLVTGKDEITFSFCDDPANTPQSAPWQRINHIKKADGVIVDSPFRVAAEQAAADKKAEIDPGNDAFRPLSLQLIEKPSSRYHPSPEELERKVNRLWLFSVWLPLLIGLMGPLVVYALAQKYRSALPGHPKEKLLRRKIKRAIVLSFLVPALFIILFTVVFPPNTLLYIFITIAYWLTN